MKLGFKLHYKVYIIKMHSSSATEQVACSYFIHRKYIMLQSNKFTELDS